MKYLLILNAGLFVFIGCNGTRPEILGIRENRLHVCPKTPNCINSFSAPDDKIHYRAPVSYKKPLPEAIAALKLKIDAYPRTEIILEKPDYLYAEFTSLIMRYVDDVEFYFDEKNKLLHFRSASRLGSGDFGVNAKRIEAILKDLDI